MTEEGGGEGEGKALNRGHLRADSDQTQTGHHRTALHSFSLDHALCGVKGGLTRPLCYHHVVAAACKLLWDTN